MRGGDAAISVAVIKHINNAVYNNDESRRYKYKYDDYCISTQK